MDWFRKLRERKLPPLTGAPAVRRQKTYSAQSGYVYQYFYEGQRLVRRGPGPGTEFVFQVTADRKTSFPVSVFVADAAVRSWEGAHARQLAATERYAVAKMALFQAFDEREDPARMRQEIQVRRADIDGFLETLGID